MITIDAREIAEFGRYLKGPMTKEVHRAMRLALNATAKQGQVKGARAIGKEMNLQQGQIKKAMAVKRASYTRLESRIDVDNRPMSIGRRRFGCRQTKRGVSFKIKRQGQRRILKRAFLFAGGVSGSIVLQRISKARYPIKLALTTSIGESFANHADMMFRFITRKLPQVFYSKLKFTRRG